MHFLSLWKRSTLFLLLAISFPVNGTTTEFQADVPLPEALDHLATTTETPIIYSSDTVRPWMRVSPPANTVELDDALNAWLPRWNLDFERRYGVVVVRHAAKNATHGVIAGRVQHAVTNEPLAGITVQLAETSLSATSAVDGTFFLQPVPAGEYTLQITSRGWLLSHSVQVILDASGIGFAELPVIESVYSLDAIVISPSFYDLEMSPTESSTWLGRSEIDAAPKLGGEVMRATGYLPGVMQDGPSARPHLRGGVADETLYLFDGVRLYDPFHLRDFVAPFSFMNAQRIASANVHVGAFPAQFGNRLSGVIEFEPAETYAKLGGEVETSLFDTSLLVSDTLSNGITSWLVSARRGHLDLILDALDPESGTPAYSDVYARLEHETANGFRVSGSFLGARDRLIIKTPNDQQSARADYDDRYYWIKAGRSLENVDFEVLASSTFLSKLRTGIADNPDEFSGTVYDQMEADIQSFSTDVTWRTTPRVRLKGGLGVEKRKAEFDYRATRQALGPLGEYGDNTDFERSFRNTFTGDAWHAYIEMRNHFGADVYTDLGWRIDHQSYPDDGQTRLGPRFALAWQLNEQAVLRLSGGRYWQAMGLEELPVSDNLTSYPAPERSDNVVAGLDWRLGSDLVFRSEFFTKQTRNPWVRSENLLDLRTLVPELESDRVRIAPESARVRGAEFSLLSKESADTKTWWMTLSFARATDRINHRDVARSWDQQWYFDAGIRWPYRGWLFEAIAGVSAGLPTTPLVLEQDGENGSPTVRLGEINSDKLKVAHGIDLRVSREWRSQGGEYSFYVEVINAYTGPNDCCVDYSLDQTETGFSLRRKSEQWYGTVPNVGFRWRF